MNPRRAIADIRYMNRLLPRAEQEAADLGDECPGAEHLLLAAAGTTGDDTARRALDAVGVTVDDLRSAVEQVHRDALAAIGLAVPAVRTAAPVSRVHRSTGPAQEAFQHAVELAHADGDRVRGGHVVMAVAAQGEGTLARALALLGVERDGLSAAARAAVRTPGSAA